jgi:diguanylate cyclase (GGDEF)-like protein
MPPPSLILLLIFSTAGCLALAATAWPRRDDTTIKAFLVLSLGASLWSMGRLMELHAPTLAMRIFWAKLQYFGIAAVPVGWLAVVMCLCRPKNAISQRVLAVWIVGAIVTLLLVFTNDQHQLVWKNILLVPGDDAPGAIFDHGPAYAYLAAYNYLLLAWSAFLLIARQMPDSRLTPPRRIALLVGLSVPLAVHQAYLQGWTYFLGGDLTPATFSVMVPIVWASTLRPYLEDVGHYVRHRIFDTLDNGCVIMGLDGIIRDFNSTAYALVPDLRRGEEAPDSWLSTLAGASATGANPHQALTIDGETPYEIRVQIVRNLHGRPVGIVAYLVDLQRYRMREQVLASENSGLNLRLREAEDKMSAMQKAIYRDSLTGLYNRRYLQERATALIEAAYANQSYFGLLVVDVDYFKQFNDIYGHVLGDECLRKIADAIAQATRGPASFAARFGGEEFCVVLTGSGPEESKAVGKRLMEAIAALAILHPGSAAGSTVTVSMGGICRIPTAPELDLLVSRADLAMYEAKRGGRNQFVMDEA